MDGGPDSLLEMMVYDRVRGAGAAEGVELRYVPKPKTSGGRELKSGVMQWTLIGLVFFGMLWESIGQPTNPTETKTDVYRIGDYDAAIHQYAAALASNPANVDLRRDLMWVLWRAQRFESCADTARSVLEYMEDDLEALNMVGRCQQCWVVPGKRLPHMIGVYPYNPINRRRAGLAPICWRICVNMKRRFKN